MNFQDCYKTLIATLLNYENWENSDIIDCCTDSNDENVILYEETLFGNTDTFLYGDNDRTSNTESCVTIPYTLEGRILMNVIMMIA